MNRNYRIVVFLALLVPLVALAGNKNEKEKKPKTFSKVSSVSPTDNSISISDSAGSNTTYTVDSFTTIVVNGKPGKLADVLSGMKADVTTSGTKVSRLEVSAPPEEKSKDKKKK